jgi:Protein of unknown function (DUF4238)
MNNPKKQHFVPEMLSKRFARPDGKFFFHDRRLDGNQIRPTTPANILHQRYLYSLTDAKGERDFSLEHRYNRLEDAASILLDRMEDVLDRGIDPILGEKNRKLLDLFIYEQWRRVPDMHELVFAREGFRSRIEAAITDYERKYGPLSDSRKSELIGSLDERDLLKEIPGRALKKSSGTVMRAFQDKTLVIVEAPSNTEFIIGSYNVVKTSDGPTDLHDRSIEIWLAFTPRFAAVLQGRTDAAARVVTGADQVDAINKAVAKKSSVIASKNLALIEVLRPGSKLVGSK